VTLYTIEITIIFFFSQKSGYLFNHSFALIQSIINILCTKQQLTGLSSFSLWDFAGMDEFADHEIACQELGNIITW
jgi:hypothetical protein